MWKSLQYIATPIAVSVGFRPTWWTIQVWDIHFLFNYFLTLLLLTIQYTLVQYTLYELLFLLILSTVLVYDTTPRTCWRATVVLQHVLDCVLTIVLLHWIYVPLLLRNIVRFEELCRHATFWWWKVWSLWVQMEHSHACHLRNDCGDKVRRGPGCQEALPGYLSNCILHDRYSLLAFVGYNRQNRA